MNALRVALRIISGRIILNFAFVALCGALQTHFHEWGHRGGFPLKHNYPICTRPLHKLCAAALLFCARCFPINAKHGILKAENKSLEEQQ